MSSSALSSAVTHSVALPESAMAQPISTGKGPVPLGLVPALAPYLGAVPDSDPPYDEVLPRPISRSARRPTSLTLPSQSRGTNTLGAPRGAVLPTEIRDVDVPGWSRDADTGVRRTTAHDLPPARSASQMLARAVIEVLSGTRQLAQLRIHCAPEVFAGLTKHIRPGCPPSSLISVRSSEPADGVVEASAVFRRQQRVAALAFRLQGVDGRWRITALQIG